MILYYMETSALLKRYRTEPGSDVIVELLERRRPDETFITSYMSRASRCLNGAVQDLHHGVARSGGHGSPCSDSRCCIETYMEPSWVALRWMLASFSCFQPVTNDTVRQAAEVTRRYALRGADALHLCHSNPR